MQFESVVQRRGPVSFPEWVGERIYMKSFKIGDDLGRFSRTVNMMMDGVESDETCFLMVDEAFVKSGTTHRRPGKHIDGWWDPTLRAHGGGGHRSPVGHGHPGRGGHRTPGGHIHAKSDDWDHSVPDWSHTVGREEGIFLASNITACVGYDGKFEGVIGEGGDCSHIDTSGMNTINMEAHNVFAGNVSMLHESVPVSFDCFRTVVRINVPHWRH